MIRLFFPRQLDANKHFFAKTLGASQRAGMRYFLPLICFCYWSAAAAEIMPPPPKQHFNDYAGVVSPGTAQQLNRELEDFERQTSSQIIVAVFPKMQSDSSIEDYTVRIAQSWKVGQKGKDNGAVLFVFINDRKMFIQTGYGLEGALPDATAKTIIENEIKPRFRAGDYNAGLTAGARAMMAAVRGEYKGTGQTVAERGAEGHGGGIAALFFLFFFFLIVASMLRRNRRQRSRYFGWGGYPYVGGWTIGSGGFAGGLGSGRGGGFSAGSFSGGGGSFGGGGAGGNW
jgi:uncharacterized protein